MMTCPAAGPARLKASSGFGTGLAVASTVKADTTSVEKCMTMIAARVVNKPERMVSNVWKQMVSRAASDLYSKALGIIETSYCRASD